MLLIFFTHSAEFLLSTNIYEPILLFYFLFSIANFLNCLILFFYSSIPPLYIYYLQAFFISLIVLRNLIIVFAYPNTLFIITVFSLFSYTIILYFCIASYLLFTMPLVVFFMLLLTLYISYIRILIYFTF